MCDVQGWRAAGAGAGVGGGRCAASGRLTAAAWVVVDWHGRGDAAAG